MASNASIPSFTSPSLIFPCPFFCMTSQQALNLYPKNLFQNIKAFLHLLFQTSQFEPFLVNLIHFLTRSPARSRFQTFNFFILLFSFSKHTIFLTLPAPLFPAFNSFNGFVRQALIFACFHTRHVKKANSRSNLTDNPCERILDHIRLTNMSLARMTFGGNCFFFFSAYCVIDIGWLEYDFLCVCMCGGCFCVHTHTCVCVCDYDGHGPLTYTFLICVCVWAVSERERGKPLQPPVFAATA